MIEGREVKACVKRRTGKKEEVISLVVIQLALDVQFSATTLKIRIFGQLTCV